MSRFYGQAGGLPTAVLFASRDDAAALEELTEAIGGLGDAAVYWIVRDPALLPGGSTGYVDANGAVAAGWGVTAASGAVVVLDPNLRVVATAAPGDPPAAVLDALAGSKHLGTMTGVESQAPVLMVPRVIDEHRCADLITQCRADAVESGVETASATEIVDRVRKRRRDVSVTDATQLQQLSTSVGRRLMPEIDRAFAYRATRFEGFKIACYDEASGGFFSPHRDNLIPATAHRVFALSINLNDDYDGGELGFPEYGQQRYRAPAGAAMVFSCALMHAVHPVTRGSRFVLLSFLYAGERR